MTGERKRERIDWELIDSMDGFLIGVEWYCVKNC